MATPPYKAGDSVPEWGRSVASAPAETAAETLVEVDAAHEMLTDSVPIRDRGQIGEGDGACGRCGTPFQPNAGRCSKCKSFAPRNQEHRGLGLTARHHPAELRSLADDLMAGIASDRGGEGELSTLERSYVRKLGDLEICIRILTEDIAINGLLTPGGTKTRDVYNDLLAGLASFDRYAQRIGLQRTAKRIDLPRALSGLDRS